MKKILTIAATALLSTIAGAAHAQTPVNFPGTVTAACTITTPGTDGVLTANTAPSTALTTAAAADAASVVVTCNDSAKTLTLTNTAVNNTIPTQTTAPIVAFGFATGGSGVFASATGTTASLANPTDAAGDTAKISASVTAATGKLLKAGSYIVVVDANITP